MVEYENLGKVNAPFAEEYKKRFQAVLDSGWFVLGNEVASFESEFASYCGAKHCVGVANGLDALFLGLLALDLPVGSEVIVPSNTYIATILAIVHAGFKPVPVEPDMRTYNIDPTLIEGRITKRTKAIMVVHLYGKACEMDPILDVCKRHGLRLIEDCAQAHGAEYKGKKVGTFGDIGAFSFYPTKNLGCLGDGGGILTDSDVLADRVRTLRNYGSKKKYYNEIPGFNSRLDEVQAAFLRVKLPHLDEINAKKQALAARYRKQISSAFILPSDGGDFYDVYHIFNIRHPERDRLKSFLLDHGIKTDIHYPIAPCNQPAMKGIMDEPCPIAEEIHATTLSLPISYSTTKEEVDKVCEALSSFR